MVMLDLVVGPNILDQVTAMEMIFDFYKRKEYVMPDAQDAVSFTVQESVEFLDCILRRKRYNRNHEQKDTIGREAAQTLLMLLVSCYLLGIDLDAEFKNLVEKS